MDAVGHGVAHKEVSQRRDREIHQYLDQRIDLVLLANRAQLQEGEPRMHGEHHDGAQKNEQGIGALLDLIH